MRAACFVTYEIVTPESASQGDVFERGFVEKAEWLSQDRVPLRLRDALRLMGCVEDCGNGRDFCEVDERLYSNRPGESTRYALHLPDCVTCASFERVKRILKAQRLLIGN